MTKTTLYAAILNRI